jgi:hypothetical protein
MASRHPSHNEWWRWLVESDVERKAEGENQRATDLGPSRQRDASDHTHDPLPRHAENMSAVD